MHDRIVSMIVTCTLCSLVGVIAAVFGFWSCYGNWPIKDELIKCFVHSSIAGLIVGCVTALFVMRAARKRVCLVMAAGCFVSFLVSFQVGASLARELTRWVF